MKEGSALFRTYLMQMVLSTGQFKTFCSGDEVVCSSSLQAQTRLFSTAPMSSGGIFGQAIEYKSKGGAEVLEIVNKKFPPPGEDEVLVKVKATGVCGRDILDRQGAYPYLQLPMTPGHEMSGVVMQVGKNAEQLWKVGDRVINAHHANCKECPLCLAGGPKCERPGYFYGVTDPGSYAQYMKCHSSSLLRLPEDVKFEEGCFLLCTAAVALRAFKHARLKKGDRVLITGASGGVGIHAIQIARAMGAHVVAITSSQKKIDTLKKYGANEIVVIGQRSQNFSSQVLPVDVVLELVGAPTFNYSLRTLKNLGRVVFVGNLTLSKVDVNPGLLITKELSVMGSSEASKEDVAEVLEMVRNNTLKPVIDLLLPLTDARRAQQVLEEKGVCGRIVLVPDPEDLFDAPPVPVAKL